MKQGEIWLIALDPTIGAEMQKTRPALIINTDTLGKLPLKVVVPITGWKTHFQDCSWMVRIDPDEQNGLSKTSAADCFQIRSVSVNRLTSRMGFVAPEIVAQIQDAITNVISLS